MTGSTEQYVKSQIQPFIDQIPLQKISFPIFSMTYSLWRKISYKKLINKIKPIQQELRIIDKQFFIASQRDLLAKFVGKLKNQLNGRQLGWRKALQQQHQVQNANRQQNSETIFAYSEAIFLEQLYVQLFKDLVTIPYLNLFSQNATFQVNPRFLNSYYQKKDQKFIDKTFNKMGKTALSKGLNIFSESIITKSFLYKMTSLVGSFNPLLMIASFSIGSLIQTYDSKNKMEKMIAEIKILTQQSLKNISFLEQHYQKCLSCIQTYLSSQKDKDLSKKIIKQIGRVLQQDWLQINQSKNGQWEVVILTEKDSFQNLQEQNLKRINLEQLIPDFQ